MGQSVKTIAAATTLSIAVLGSSLSAQQFSASAISIDIDISTGTDLGENEGLLVIAAYQPPTTAPRFGTRLNAGGNARASVTGKPKPSIILGRVAPGREADFGIEAVLPETAKAFGFAYNDLDARDAMRKEDPELFNRLVKSGSLNPPQTEEAALEILQNDHPRILTRAAKKANFSAVDTLLKVVLQTELKRMNCYRSGVDGDWGGGSRSSAGRYFDALKDAENLSDSAATGGLFQAILLNGDTVCKVAVLKRATTRARSTGTTTTTTQPQAAAPPRQTQTQPTNLGTGVFR